MGGRQETEETLAAKIPSRWGFPTMQPPTPQSSSECHFKLVAL